MPISAVDRKNALEFGVSLTLTALTLPFVATPAGQIALATTTLGISCLNVLWRTYAPNHALSRCGRAIGFALIDQTTLELVTHELSHAATACALFQRATPSITIVPWIGGMTDYGCGHGLTRLGQWLGKQNARTLISSAGPACNVFSALAKLVTGHKFRKSHPELSTYCRVSAIVSIANTALYALAALAKQSVSDFAVLARAGVHPVAAAVFIIALPIVLQVGLSLRSAMA